MLSCLGSALFNPPTSCPGSLLDRFEAHASIIGHDSDSSMKKSLGESDAISHGSPIRHSGDERGDQASVWLLLHRFAGISLSIVTVATAPFRAARRSAQ
jgi:hypothetical protein